MTRSVLITGAANGLGLVISRHLWQQGYQVAMADLNLDTVTRSARRSIPASSGCCRWRWIFASRNSSATR